jgi:hypothetical protein
MAKRAIGPRGESEPTILFSDCARLTPLGDTLYESLDHRRRYLRLCFPIKQRPGFPPATLPIGAHLGAQDSTRQFRTCGSPSA